MLTITSVDIVIYKHIYIYIYIHVFSYCLNCFKSIITVIFIYSGNMDCIWYWLPVFGACRLVSSILVVDGSLLISKFIKLGIYIYLSYCFFLKNVCALLLITIKTGSSYDILSLIRINHFPDYVFCFLWYLILPPQNFSGIIPAFHNLFF